MDALSLTLLTLAAYLTAVLSAIIGMGGGITLLGCMTLLMPAAHVIPVHGIVQLVSNSTRTIAFFRSAAFRLLRLFLPGLAIGIVAGAALFAGSDLRWFQPFIGGFVLALVVWRRFAPRLRNPPDWVYPVLGACAGFATLFVGATGPLLAPFFLRDDLDKAQVVATKAACQTAAHLVKVPAFLAMGYGYGEQWLPLAVLSAAVVAGTFTGKRLQARLSQGLFVRLFETVLVMLGIILVSRAPLFH